MAISPFLPSSCSPDLLHIVLNAFGHIDMDDTLKVRKIETHAQSDGGYDHFNRTVPELGQSVGFFLVGESRVIDGSVELS